MEITPQSDHTEMKKKHCWTVQGTDPCLSCGNSTASFDTLSNITQYTKQTHFCIYAWTKHFSSHGPGSGQRYCSWTSRTAQLSIQSSNPKHCSVVVVELTWEACWSLVGTEPLEEVQEFHRWSMRAAGKAGTQGHAEAAGGWHTTNAMNSWDRRTLSEKKSGEKNIVHNWKIRNEVQ